MTPKKPSTLAQRFGFQDSQLTTPEHDAIMIWLDGQAEKICGSLIPNGWKTGEIQSGRDKVRDSWERDIESAKRSIIRETKAMESYASGTSSGHEKFEENRRNGIIKYKDQISKLQSDLQELSMAEWRDPDPRYPEIKVDKVWEKTIGSGNYTIGFIDMEMTTYTHSASAIMSNPPRWEIKSEPVKFYFEVKPVIPSLGEVIRQVRMYQPYIKGKFFIVSPDTRFRSHLESQGIGFIESPKF